MILLGPRSPVGPSLEIYLHMKVLSLWCPVVKSHFNPQSHLQKHLLQNPPKSVLAPSPLYRTIVSAIQPLSNCEEYLVIVWNVNFDGCCSLEILMYNFILPLKLLMLIFADFSFDFLPRYFHPLSQGRFHNYFKSKLIKVGKTSK